MSRSFLRRPCPLFLLLAGFQQAPVPGPESGPEAEAPTAQAPAEWTDTHQVAREVVSSPQLVTLITGDQDGQPQARIVESMLVDREAMYVLIHFEPVDGEVFSFSAELVGDSLTWAAPEFQV